MIIRDERSLVERTIEIMMEKLQSDEWEPGAKIPSEVQLSKDINVGRNTVRSAIQSLKDLGHLVSEQGKGTFVSSHNSRLDSLFPIIQFSSSDIFGIFEFREVVEVACIKLAIQRISTEGLDNILNAINKMKNSQNDLEKYILADYHFHLSIAKESKNDLLYHSLFILRGVICRHIETMDKTLKSVSSLKEHEQIYHAIAEKNIEKAVKLLRDDFDRAIKIFKEMEK
jgi:GntR family transcriptional regulator, transcriptional repressor for pyruvate dehydrogenase complex